MSLTLKFYTQTEYDGKNMYTFSDFLWTLLVHVYDMCTAISCAHDMFPSQFALVCILSLLLVTAVRPSRIPTPPPLLPSLMPPSPATFSTLPQPTHHLPDVPPSDSTPMQPPSLMSLPRLPPWRAALWLHPATAAPGRPPWRRRCRPHPQPAAVWRFAHLNQVP
jgi:hypothetical protein